MTVAELSHRISGLEVRRWIALWEIEAKEQRNAELAAKAQQGAADQVRNPRRKRAR